MTHITADAYAELLRAHTRAIHRINGLEDGDSDFCDYPEHERRAMGLKASGVLAAAREAEGSVAPRDKEQR